MIGRSSTVLLVGKPREGILLKKKKRVVEAVNGKVKNSGGLPENKVNVCSDDVNNGSAQEICH
ncbi:uncharacterized protein DS421_10g304370 [Arachis hypogaea]|nr:uncharacterized protein DS421_10g304370 [Arachis hypogaea]